MKWLITFTVFLFGLFSGNSLAVASDNDLFEQGESAIDERNYKQATSYFTDFLKSEPENQAARYNLALSYYKTDNTALCLENLRKIKNWKKQKRSLSLASWCAYSHAETDSALHWLDLVSDGEKTSDMLMLKALILAEKDPKTSKLLLDQALLMDPAKLDILFYRAEVFLYLKDTAKAIKDLNVFLTHKKSAEAFAKRAAIKKSKNDIEAAAADYHEAFQLQADVKWKYAQLELFAENGNYSQAREIATSIKDNFPGEREKIRPIQRRLNLLDWLNSYWLYGVLALLLLVLLIFFLFFKR